MLKNKVSGRLSNKKINKTFSVRMSFDLVSQRQKKPATKFCNSIIAAL